MKKTKETPKKAKLKKEKIIIDDESDEEFMGTKKIQILIFFKN